MKSCKANDKYYLTCERNWVYFTLICVAGFWGAYTYLLRGNIFCNAQTGNVVLMGLALGSAEWGKALYYLVPISAYILGSFVSELLPNPIKHRFFVRWDTVLIFIEMAAVLILGCIPDSAPVQISQVIINFLASMQYNTFRQAEGVAVATTFVTNHIRQVGIGLAKEPAPPQELPTSPTAKVGAPRGHAVLLRRRRGGGHGVLPPHSRQGHLGDHPPLAVIFVTLLHADLTTEKELFEQKPSGH